MAVASVSVITLSTRDQAKARRFYGDGFGWSVAFEADEITFYQLNGTVLGLYSANDFAGDMGVDAIDPSGGFALAHNVASEDEVAPLIDRLIAAGGALVRSADAPPHGGLRGYVRDPDGHAWEIAWNPGFPMDADGNVRVGEAT
jgi:catechol 2,3-dioxygenase-like lactoylglutathione lyase family enzyme